LAREASGDDLAELARRLGVRIGSLRAIEEGRFGDLPEGIYGRSAIRAFATAYGFDPAEILESVEPLLRPLDEPIAALGRLKGIRKQPGASPPLTASVWRRLAASVVDAAIVVAVLLVVVGASAAALSTPVSALDPGASSFGIMGVLFAAAYHLCFGGVAGATAGERALGLPPRGDEPRSGPLTLDLVWRRALWSATEDVRCLQDLAVRASRLMTRDVEQATSYSAH